MQHDPNSLSNTVEVHIAIEMARDPKARNWAEQADALGELAKIAFRDALGGKVRMLSSHSRPQEPGTCWICGDQHDPNGDQMVTPILCVNCASDTLATGEDTILAGFRVPDGTTPDDLMERIGGWSEDQRTLMGWMAECIGSVRGDGILCSPGAAPLTADEITDVLEVLSWHAHYDQQRVIITDNNGQAITLSPTGIERGA
jgi:hypothetical protein